MKKRDVASIVKDNSGFRLDIGCGASKMEGYVGMDLLPLPGVDIVHNLEDTPWPIEDESVLQIVASHIMEHVNPHGGTFINVMNECWRVLKPDCKLAIACPYAGSPGFWQDPTHCNGITEATMYYFDPDPEQKYVGNALYRFYQPKPWRIEFMAADRNGNLEILLKKRIDVKDYHSDTPADITKEVSGVHRKLF